MIRRVVLPGLVVLTLLVGARTLGVGHLSDDWVILGHVSRHGNADAWTGPWLGMSDESILYYRPLFSGLFALEYALFGTDPFPAHVHHLLWHLAAVVLLFLLLRRLGVSPSGAALGALLFAWYPYLGGPTGWLAARCGMVAGTLTLGAVVAWLRHRDPTHEPGVVFPVLALVCAVTSVFSQESGYLALVAPLTADLVLDRPRARFRTLAVRHAPFAAAGVLLLVLRWWALGTLGGGYPQPTGVLAGGDATWRSLEQAGGTLLRIPGALPPEFMGGQLLPAAAAGIVALLVLVWGFIPALRNPGSPARSHLWWRRGAPALLIVLGVCQTLLLVLPANPTFSPGTGHRWYAALAFFCGTLGLAASPLLDRGRTAALPLALVPLYLWGHVLVQDQLLEADAGVKKVLARILGELESEPLPKGPVFVSCLQQSRQGIPTFHWGLAEALNPPFQSKPCRRPIYPIHRFMYLGPGFDHDLHPPVEALLFLEGGDPLLLAMADPYGHEATEIRRFNFTMPGPEPGAPQVAISPEQVLVVVKNSFEPYALELIEPVEAVTPRALPLRMPIAVRATDLDRVELFVFTPTFDTRLEVEIRDGLARYDLGPKLEDYVRFRGEVVDVYVVAVGYRATQRTRPLLSPLLTYRVTP